MPFFDLDVIDSVSLVVNIPLPHQVKHFSLIYIVWTVYVVQYFKIRTK